MGCCCCCSNSQKRSKDYIEAELIPQKETLTINNKDTYFLAGGVQGMIGLYATNLLQYKLSNNRLIKDWSEGIMAKDGITFDVYKDQLESPQSSQSMMWMAWGWKMTQQLDLTHFNIDYGDQAFIQGNPDYENPKDFSPKVSIYKACISKDNKYLFTIESGNGTLCQWDINNQILDHYYGKKFGLGLNIAVNNDTNYQFFSNVYGALLQIDINTHECIYNWTKYPKNLEDLQNEIEPHNQSNCDSSSDIPISGFYRPEEENSMISAYFDNTARFMWTINYNRFVKWDYEKRLIVKDIRLPYDEEDELDLPLGGGDEGTDGFRDLHFTKDGRYYFIQNNIHQLFLMSTETDEIVHKLEKNILGSGKHIVKSMVASLDSKFLFIAGTGGLVQWSIDKRKVCKKYEGFANYWVNSMMVTPDKKFLILTTESGDLQRVNIRRQVLVHKKINCMNPGYIECMDCIE